MLKADNTRNSRFQLSYLIHNLPKSTWLGEWIWDLEVMLKWKTCRKDPQHVQFWGLGLRQGKFYLRRYQGQNFYMSLYYCNSILSGRC